MSWNYRVISTKSEDGEDILVVSEVYYNSKGEIKAVSEDPVYLAEENINTLKEVLKKIHDAFEKEVLVYDEIEFSSDLD